MEADLVSIIVPAYNVAGYLERAINCILNQDYPMIEAILVDDGSTDGKTGSMCDTYASGYSNIMAVHKKNGGVTSARNYGLKYASGEFLYFFDPDDWMDQNLISSAVFAAKKYSADYVIFGYYMELADFNGNYIRTACQAEKQMYYESKSDFFQDFVGLCNQSLMYNVWNKLYKKDIVSSTDLHFKEAPPAAEDFVFNLEYACCVHKAVVLPDCFYHYVREREGNLSTTFRPDWFEIRIQQHQYFLEFFQRMGLLGAEGKEYLARRHAERILGCIENEFSPQNPASATLKRERIRSIITHPLTIQAFQEMHPHSLKTRIMSIPVRKQAVCLTCLMGRILSFVRCKMPKLFFKLKAKR